MPLKGEQSRQEHQRAKTKAAEKGRTQHMTVRVKPDLFQKLLAFQSEVARLQQTHAPSLDTTIEVVLEQLNPGELACRLYTAGRIVEPGRHYPRDVSASLRKVKA